nr:hypothetical protein [Tanacetum cinerariifolium]
MFQCLSRYPTSVRVFLDHILFLAGLKPSWEHEMAFRNFIYTKDDDDLAFLPKEPSLGFDSRESLKAGVFVVHPRSVAARIKERKCKTMGGLLDCFELKDANDCHLKISAITPPSWKGHLDNQMDLELLDLHDRYARQAMMDNVVNRRAREFLQVIEKMSGEADVIKARERSREEECEGLRVKCEAAIAEFDQNPDVLALQEKISSLNVDVKEHKEVDKARLEAVEVSLHKEVRELKQDRRDVVSKVVPYAAMELLHNATALNETLLSKKPPMLQKHAPSRTQMPMPSSQKATLSSTPSLNSMSPSFDLVKPPSSPLE